MWPENKIRIVKAWQAQGAGGLHFTPVRIALGLVILLGKTYLLGFVLALVPVVIMELSKAFGLIKHQH